MCLLFNQKEWQGHSLTSSFNKRRDSSFSPKHSKKPRTQKICGKISLSLWQMRKIAIQLSWLVWRSIIFRLTSEHHRQPASPSDNVVYPFRFSFRSFRFIFVFLPARHNRIFDGWTISFAFSFRCCVNGKNLLLGASWFYVLLVEMLSSTEKKLPTHCFSFDFSTESVSLLVGSWKVLIIITSSKMCVWSSSMKTTINSKPSFWRAFKEVPDGDNLCLYLSEDTG